LPEITKSGSRIRINGVLVNATQVQELRGKLLNIHAQHEARTLLSRESQLEILDLLGDKSHKALQQKVQAFYGKVKELRDLLAQLSISEEERLRRLDFARFQSAELEEAALNVADEDEQLAAQKMVLANSQTLEEKVLTAQKFLNEDEVCAVDL